jgi:hypothetical protein
MQLPQGRTLGLRLLGRDAPCARASHGSCTVRLSKVKLAFTAAEK